MGASRPGSGEGRVAPSRQGSRRSSRRSTGAEPCVDADVVLIPRLKRADSDRPERLRRVTAVQFHLERLDPQWLCPDHDGRRIRAGPGPVRPNEHGKDGRNQEAGEDGDPVRSAKVRFQARRPARPRKNAAVAARRPWPSAQSAPGRAGSPAPRAPRGRSHIPVPAATGPRTSHLRRGRTRDQEIEHPSQSEDVTGRTGLLGFAAPAPGPCKRACRRSASRPRLPRHASGWPIRSRSGGADRLRPSARSSA